MESTHAEDKLCRQVRNHVRNHIKLTPLKQKSPKRGKINTIVRYNCSWEVCSYSCLSPLSPPLSCQPTKLKITEENRISGTLFVTDTIAEADRTKPSQDRRDCAAPCHKEFLLLDDCHVPVLSYLLMTLSTQIHINHKRQWPEWTEVQIHNISSRNSKAKLDLHNEWKI